MIKDSFKNDLKYVYRFIILIKPYWKNLFEFIFINFIVVLISLPTPWLLKIFIDNVIIQQDFNYIYIIVSFFITLTILRSIISFFQNYYFGYISQEISIMSL